jgi:hypothetical protein
MTMNQMQTQQFRPNPNGAPRFDLYRRIHKALRAFMGETMVLVGQLDSYDTEQVAAAMTQVRSMAVFCEAHLAHEDTFVHPAMDKGGTTASQPTADEHVHHVSACRQIEAMAAAVRGAAASLRPALIDELYHGIALFMAESLVHMHAEETENNALLWQLHDDQALIAIEHAIVDSLEPDEKMLSLRWMLPAMNPTERLMMLSNARMGMPSEVFEGMLNGVKDFLKPGDWNKLIAGLYGIERKAA